MNEQELNLKHLLEKTTDTLQTYRGFNANFETAIQKAAQLGAENALRDLDDANKLTPVQKANLRGWQPADGARRHAVSKSASLDPGTEIVFTAIQKALGGDNPSGGYLIPEAVSPQAIERVTNQSVVRKTGARIIPVPNGILDVPRVDSGPTVSWGAPNATITASQPTFGQVRLQLKEAHALIRAARPLVQDSGGLAQSVVVDDLAREFSKEEDRAFLNGTGIGNEPLGLMNRTDVNIQTSVTTANFSDATLRAMILKCRLQNFEPTGWAMHPTLMDAVMGLEDDNHRPLLIESLIEGQPPRLFGLPVFLSNNAASGTDLFCIVADWREALIGQAPQGLEITASEHFAFAENQVAIRGILRVDFNLRHEGAFTTLVVDNS